LANNAAGTYPRGPTVKAEEPTEVSDEEIIRANVGQVEGASDVKVNLWFM